MGSTTSDSTPPRLAASRNSRTRSQKRLAAGSPPFRSKAIIVPNPRICFFASWGSGCEANTGKVLYTWYQFSRPSGIFIDAQDNIYVADSESQSVGSGRAREWKRGIRIGSAKDGSVRAFIPDPIETANNTSSAEGIAVDPRGVIYGAQVQGPPGLRRYVKQ